MSTEELVAGLLAADKAALLGSLLDVIKQAFVASLSLVTLGLAVTVCSISCSDIAFAGHYGV